ncbi:MAG: hypothetical protein DRJ42_04005 [Deltaproteobacteria bacterium]|nr:MAG: hypothetical protein DRJ42_04005 [Deltaproteobacteria bacterium]
MVITSTAAAVLVVIGGCSLLEGPPYFIPGSATLPDCTEAPAVDVTGRWFDGGELTIQTDGCAGTAAGDVLTVCALDWQMTQSGAEVSIVVDEEYRLEGRVCGDQLYLQGGWWLPTEDPPYGCTYEDDTAEEVGIEAAGNVLRLADARLAGTLVVRGGCLAEYAMALERSGP